MFGDPNGESKHEKVKFSKCSSNLTKGPFGSDMKKSLYVDKSDSTYKVYLQLNALQKDQSLGEYYISESYFKQKMFKYEVKPGDFIITCDGTLGEMLQLKEPMERGVISPSLMRVSLLNDKMNDRYFEALWKYYMLPVMAGQARNSCLMHLPSAKTLGAIEVPLPSLELQKVYSEFLEQSDKSKFVVENSG